MAVAKVLAAGGAGAGPPGGVGAGIRSFAAIFFLLIFISLFDHYFLIGKTIIKINSKIIINYIFRTRIKYLRNFIMSTLFYKFKSSYPS